MKRVIGGAMVAAPFVAFAAAMVVKVGWIVTAATFGTAFGVTAMMCWGITLMTEEER